MRFLFAIVGGALAVCLLTLLAVGIYAMFPQPDDVIEVTPIILDDVVMETDYTIEGLQCECKSQQLKYDIEQTKSGLGCKLRVLSHKQRMELPVCELEVVPGQI